MRARMLTLAAATAATLANAPAGALTHFDMALGDLVTAKNPDVPRCSPESAPGSLYDINALRDGDVEFALAQSDRQRRAHEGTDVFAADGLLETLRGVMGLYPEAVTLLVGSESGIRSLRDLRGRIIDIGLPSSGRRGTARYLLQALGLEGGGSRTSSDCPPAPRSRRSATE